MIRIRRFALFFVLAGFLLASTLSERAQQKFSRLHAAELPSGARVDLSAAELTAWATEEAKIYAPGATRNIRIQTRKGEATGTMMLDFLKVRQAATGDEPGWLMKTLFSGEKQVLVSARFQSQQRRARVDVLRVEVSGVPIQGRALDFLIQNWLRPTFPSVHINEWFNLGLRIDHFTVTPAGASVFIGR